MFIMPYDLAPIREVAAAVGARVMYDGGAPARLDRRPGTGKTHWTRGRTC